MKSLRLPLFLLKDEKFGTSRIRFTLALSLSLGVSALVALERFAERVENTIKRDSKSLMAADFQVQAWRDFDAQVLKAVEKYRVSGNLVEQTDLVASANPESGKSFTISLRALRGEKYPFYGSLVTEPQIGLKDITSQPYAIVDSSLKARGLKIGDALKIGEINFQIKAFLKSEPQTVASAFSLGPRVMIHLNWAEKNWASRAWNPSLQGTLDQELSRLQGF